MSKDKNRRPAFEMITSRHNPLVRLAREVREGKHDELIFVEGLRLCEEAVGAGLSISAVLFTESFMRDARAARLIEELSASAERVASTSDAVMESISDTKTPQGIVVLARRPQTNPAALEATNQAPLLVVMHRVSNPSNAGAILRVAEAAGATGAVTTHHTTDIFSPKSLRGAMGSTFRLPLWTGAQFADVAAWCNARGIMTVGTSLDANLTHTEYDWTRPSAVIVGAEGSGLGAEESAATDVSIRIPMRPPVESLNVAAALAVVLYEAARQRKTF